MDLESTWCDLGVAVSDHQATPTHQLFSDIPEPRNTKERIVFVAMDLFYTYGFHAVGLEQILDSAKLTKTTFYNHFTSRDELAKEAIMLRDEWESTAFKRALHEKAGYDPKALLLACFDVLDDWFTEPRYRGCLFLMAMADYPLPHHDVHQAAARHYMMARGEYTKMAEAAGVADPPRLAKQWAILLMGAVTAFLLDRDPDAAKLARATAERLLDAAIPSRGVIEE